MTESKKADSVKAKNVNIKNINTKNINTKNINTKNINTKNINTKSINYKNIEINKDKVLVYFTIPIVVLIILCSGIGILNQDVYAKETIDWMSQCLGQDISNLVCVAPILIISAFLITKGVRGAKIIWAGTMLTNIYSYVIYAFAVHFNFLFHLYCLILGLSIYAVIYFFSQYMKEDFREWYEKEVATRAVGNFLLIVGILFVLLWLSQSLPAALTNTVPDSILSDGLLTNPVHALDFSFYLPLMFVAAVKLKKKKALGFLLAPMMLVFAGITSVNIISLMVVSTIKTSADNTPMIIAFSILLIICLVFLCLMLRKLIKERI